MKKPNYWETVKPEEEYVKLPVGGYICTIMNAEEKEYGSKSGGTFSKLLISFDISEGDYKDHFKKDYQGQVKDPRKWKGVFYNLYCPQEEQNTDQSKRTASRFSRFLEDLKASNNGYEFDWNEKNLKGKKIGIIFQNTEWEYDGKTGWKAQPFKICSVEDIKTSNFTIPNDKPLDSNKSNQTSTANDYAVIDDSEDLPF